MDAFLPELPLRVLSFEHWSARDFVFKIRKADLVIVLFHFKSTNTHVPWKLYIKGFLIFAVFVFIINRLKVVLYVALRAHQRALFLVG